MKLLDHSYSGEIAAGTAGVLGLAQATLADTPGINFAGGDVVYYTGDGLSSGNHKTALISSMPGQDWFLNLIILAGDRLTCDPFLMDAQKQL